MLAGSRCATLDKQGKGRASKRRLAKTMKYSVEGLGQTEGSSPEGGVVGGKAMMVVVGDDGGGRSGGV